MTNHGNADNLREKLVKFDRSENMEFATPGQVFVDDGKKVRGVPCWMLICCHNYDQEIGVNKDGEEYEYVEVDEGEYNEEYDEDDLDEDWVCDGCCGNWPYLVPLLPLDFNPELENKIFKLRNNYTAPLGFLDRQDSTFCLPSYARLPDFWQYRPNFTSKQSLTEVFPLLETSINQMGKYLFPQSDYHEGFMRHFYVASDQTKNLLLLFFEDNTYRPEVMQIELANTKQTWRYEDLYDRFANMTRLRAREVERLFHKIDESVINTLNNGLNGFQHLATTELRPAMNNKYRAEGYNILNDLSEVSIVPTIWYDQVTDDAKVFLDAFGDWQKMRTGGVCLDYGQFRFQHDPGSKGVGLVRRRRQKRKAV